MANKRQLQELQKLLTDIEKKYASISKVSPFKGKDAAEVAKQFDSIDDALKSAEISMKGIRAEIQDIDSGLDGLKESFRDIGRELGNINSPMKAMKKDFNKLTSLAEKLSDVNYDIASSSLKETANIRKQVNLSFNRLSQRKKTLKFQIESGKLSDQELSDAQELLAIAEDATKELEEKVGYQDDFNAALDSTEKKQRNINKAMGISGGLVKGLGKFASKIGFGEISSNLEDINDDMSEMAIKLTDNGSKAASLGDKFKVMRVGLKGLGKSLSKQLADPAVIGGFLMKAVKGLYDLAGQQRKFAKEAGLATSGAVSSETLRRMESVHGMFEDLAASANILRTELGFVPEMTEKTLQGVTALTHGYGLAGNEAANLFKTSSELGTELIKMPEVVAGVGGEVENATGYAVDFQKAMKNLGSSSASVRFNMKGQANELIKAANYAALLGMSMDDVRNAAESTLSFESSIQKEMEAEMFLQKNLNLDKYRYAALTGDAATQASELQRLIKENGPALKGNVLAQRAFADSIGISQEQLASSLESMELQKELGFESADAQKAMGILMAKGMTKEQALIKMRKDGAAGVTKSIKDEEAFQNRFKMAMRKFQEAFATLADRIFNPDNMKKIDKMIEGIGDFLMSPILQKIIKYLPEIAIGFGALSLLKKFNPIQNVGVLNVARMNGGGMGGGGGGGGGGYHETGGGKSKSKGRYRDPKTGRYAKRPKGRSSRPRRRRGGRGRGLLGLAGGLLGYELMSNMFSDSETGETSVGGDMASMASMSAVDAGVSSMGSGGASSKASSASPKSKPRSKPRSRPRSKPKAGKSFLGSLWGGIKSIGSSVYSAGKGVYDMGASAISKVSDIGGSIKKWFGKKIGGLFPKLLKMAKGPIKNIAGKIPILGSILEMIFTGMDVNSIAQSKDMSKQEMYGEMGRSVISGGMGLLGGSLAAAGVSSLQAIGIPGWLLSGAAYMGGDYLGRMLGSAISDYVGGPSLGKGIFNLFYEGGANKKASTAGGNMEKSPKMMATGGIVTSATNAIVGEAGAEAVVPLNDFYAKLDELIAVVKQGGDVYMDGAKVGKSMAMSTSRLG